jgi:ADP-ribose pyrophosphatase YjhB (NUDIX family)
MTDGGPAGVPRWHHWASRLRAVAQNGRAYARDPFDLDRYREVERIAAEMMAEGTGTAPERLAGLFEQEVGYATPKLCVRGAVFRDGRLLLIRERTDDRWSLPGGWADIGESPAENVVKEIREESGFETRASKLLAVWDNWRHGHQPLYPLNVYTLIFRCEILGGEARTSVETSAVGFFGLEDLPELSGGRVTEAQITRLFEHQGEPDRPTEFD